MQKMSNASKSDEISSRISMQQQLGVDPSSDWLPWCKDNGMYIKHDELIEYISSYSSSSGSNCYTNTTSSSNGDSSRRHLIVVDCRDSDVAGGAVKGSMNIPDGDWYNRSPTLIDRIVNIATNSTNAATTATTATTNTSTSASSRSDRVASLPKDDEDNTIAMQPDATISVHKPNSSSSSSAIGEVRGEDLDLAEDNVRSVEIVVVLHCMESLRRGPRCARRLFLQLQEQLGLELEEATRTELGLELVSDTGLGLGLGLAANVRVKVKLRVLEGGADRWVRKYYNRGDLVEAFDDDYWGFSFDSNSHSNGDGVEK